jgi:hypothetical protein
MPYFMEDPFDRITDVHFKKKKGDDHEPPPPPWCAKNCGLPSYGQYTTPWPPVFIYVTNGYTYVDTLNCCPVSGAYWYTADGDFRDTVQIWHTTTGEFDDGIPLLSAAVGPLYDEAIYGPQYHGAYAQIANGGCGGKVRINFLEGFDLFGGPLQTIGVNVWIKKCVGQISNAFGDSASPPPDMMSRPPADLEINIPY